MSFSTLNVSTLSINRPLSRRSSAFRVDDLSRAHDGARHFLYYGIFIGMTGKCHSILDLRDKYRAVSPWRLNEKWRGEHAAFTAIASPCRIAYGYSRIIDGRDNVREICRVISSEADRFLLPAMSLNGVDARYVDASRPVHDDGERLFISRGHFASR